VFVKHILILLVTLGDAGHTPVNVLLLLFLLALVLPKLSVQILLPHGCVSTLMFLLSLRLNDFVAVGGIMFKPILQNTYRLQ
jgi:hypothetical protein